MNPSKTNPLRRVRQALRRATRWPNWPARYRVCRRPCPRRPQHKQRPLFAPARAHNGERCGRGSVFTRRPRGVGKTSLAYTAAILIQSSDRTPIYVQCSPGGCDLHAGP